MKILYGGLKMKLLNVTQLSEILNIKKKTIYDWTHKGLIPYIKLGHLLRFDPDIISKWVKSNSCTKISRSKNGYIC